MIGVFFMPKYSEDFKNKIASEYFDTEITQSELSKKYCVSQSSVFKWIEKYKNNSKDLALIKKYCHRTPLKSVLVTVPLTDA